MAKVLIVEDDLLISDLLEDVLVEAGYEVAGVATTVSQGTAVAERERPDLAVIDVRLADGSDGTELAARLMRQPGLGVLYTTGNADSVLSRAVAGHACLRKPYRPSDVVRALRVVAETVATGAAPSSLPPGLIMLQGQPTADRR